MWTSEQEWARFRKVIASWPVSTILRNARRIGRFKRQPNWVVAMEAYGLGSTYATMLCLEHGFDHDGFEFTPLPAPPAVAREE